jgi:hypothetical protein
MTLLSIIGGVYVRQSVAWNLAQDLDNNNLSDTGRELIVDHFIIARANVAALYFRVRVIGNDSANFRNLDGSSIYQILLSAPVSSASELDRQWSLLAENIG